MRKDILYLVIVLSVMTNYSNILFAQSSKEKFNALNDYLETVKEYSTKKVIIVKEKKSSNMTIHLLKVNDIWAIDSVGNGKFDENFYKEKDWKIINKTYKNPLIKENGNYLENKYWTENDFRNKKITFMSLKGSPWDIVFKDYYDTPEMDSYIVFTLTEPIYYKNKRYLVFTVSKSEILGGFGTSTLMIAMKKNKDKWIRVYEGYPDWHN
jgi:hypothetical protein